MEGFKVKVQEWWCSFIISGISGTPNYIQATKISMLKVKLKEWSKEHQGELEGKKKPHPRSNSELGDHPRGQTFK